MVSFWSDTVGSDCTTLKYVQLNPLWTTRFNLRTLMCQGNP